jgi:hypothetical protein
MRNDGLIFTNLWNSCCCTATGDPSTIRERLTKILNKSREQEIFNEERLDAEDETAIADLVRDLDVLIDHLEYIEKSITAIALKYKKSNAPTEIEGKNK